MERSGDGEVGRQRGGGRCGGQWAASKSLQEEWRKWAEPIASISYWCLVAGEVRCGGAYVLHGRGCDVSGASSGDGGMGLFSRADRAPSVLAHYPTQSTLPVHTSTHVATTFGWTMALEMAASLMMASG